MGLAEQTLAKLPSARGTLITHCTFRRTRYVPARDRDRPLLEQFARSIAAYLLKVDDRRSPAQIAEELSCTEKRAAELAQNGEQVVRSSGEALELIATIRDDVYESLERVGMQMMLGEEKREPEPVIHPVPDTPPKAIAFVGKTLDVPVDLMVGPSRYLPETDARHIAMSLVQHIRPQFSRKQVGDLFGKRDHSTALAALRRVDKTVRGLKDDTVLLAKIERVRARLGLELSAFYFVEKGH